MRGKRVGVWLGRLGLDKALRLNFLDLLALKDGNVIMDMIPFTLLFDGLFGERTGREGWIGGQMGRRTVWVWTTKA